MLETTRNAIETIARTDKSITSDMLTNALDLLEGNKEHDQIKAERLITIKEAAEILSVSEKYVWPFVKRENIPIIKLGERHRRLRYSDLIQFIHRKLLEQSSNSRILPHEWHKIKQQNNTNVK